MIATRRHRDPNWELIEDDTYTQKILMIVTFLLIIITIMILLL